MGELPEGRDQRGLGKRERNPLVTAPTTDDARRAIRALATLPGSSGPSD